MKPIYIENSICPICDSSKNVSIGPVYYVKNITAVTEWLPVPDQIPILKQCSNCKFGFLTKTYTPEFIDESYHRNTQLLWPSNKLSYKPKYYELRETLLKKYAVNSNVLDIGCFDCGWLLSLEPTWERYGIEPANISPFPENINVSNTTLKRAVLEEGFFGAITLFDIVEHMAKPKDDFAKIYKCLAPGGVVVVETGNLMSYFARFMGDKWYYLAMHPHISFFCLESIKVLFARSSIELIYFKGIHRGSANGLYNIMTQATKAVGYRIFSKSVELFPESKKLKTIKQLYEHSPPVFLLHDHFIAIGKKVDSIK